MRHHEILAIARFAHAKYVPRIGREPAPMVADYDAEIAASLYDSRRSREEHQTEAAPFLSKAADHRRGAGTQLSHAMVNRQACRQDRVAVPMFGRHVLNQPLHLQLPFPVFGDPPKPSRRTLHVHTIKEIQRPTVSKPPISRQRLCARFAAGGFHHFGYLTNLSERDRGSDKQ